MRQDILDIEPFAVLQIGTLALIGCYSTAPEKILRK